MDRTTTNDSIRIDTKRGTAVFQEPSPGIVVYRVVGFADIEIFRALLPDLQAALTRTGRLELFADAGRLEGYDARFRLEWVDWFIANREKLVDVHVYVRSKLARMGVSVANLATGGMLRPYASVTLFDAALRKSAPTWRRQSIPPAS
ncbi:MAG TPA: hypothetical protein VK524_00190 [Polyangiaceae bacterium]|nr:hypothetical protein [Polyangiaceae bacterium]